MSTIYRLDCGNCGHSMTTENEPLDHKIKVMIAHMDKGCWKNHDGFSIYRIHQVWTSY